MNRLLVVATVAFYVVAVKAAQSIAPARWRSALFALFNMVAVLLIFEWPGNNGMAEACRRMAVYGGVVVVQFILTRVFARQAGLRPWIAFSFPIVMLVLVRYLGRLWLPWADKQTGISLSVTFVGISFMAFRLSKLVIDVRSGAVEMPGVWDFLGFAFFVPTMIVGPINPTKVHMQSLAGSPAGFFPIRTCLARIVVGATKTLFLGGALSHLTYADFYLDGHPHRLGDFAVSAVAYYLFLYCNFSGFCDMAIGVAGLMRISVIENFRSPLLSRNITDFWSRWHISLSNYVREVVFNPLSSALARRVGRSRINQAIAISLLVTFLVTGVWHGVGWRFAVFGLLHGAAMVVHHYYNQFLRRRLTRVQLRRYNESRVVRAAAVAGTFAFISLTITLFANDWPDLARIVQVTPHLAETSPFPPR